MHDSLVGSIIGIFPSPMAYIASGVIRFALLVFVVTACLLAYFCDRDATGMKGEYSGSGGQQNWSA